MTKNTEVSEYIYFDNNATIPMTPRALKILGSIGQAGNMSSNNPVAAHWRKEVNKFEELLRDNLGASESDFQVIWNSGSTESNCTMINMFTIGNPGRTIICSRIEHKCLLESVKQAERFGTRVIWVDPRLNGTIDPKVIEEILVTETSGDYYEPILVCIMHANNETGAINNIQEIGRIISDFSSRGPVYFYSDCAQTFGKLSIRMSESPFIIPEKDQVYISVGPDGYVKVTGTELDNYVHRGQMLLIVNKEKMNIRPRILLDGICFSGHKIGGPTGIGSLVVSGRFLKECSFVPMTGAQNSGLRGGTYNTSGIMSTREAYVDMLVDHSKDVKNNLRGKQVILESLREYGIPTIKYTDYVKAIRRPAKCLVYFETDDPEDTLSGTFYCSIVYNSCSRQICNLSLNKMILDSRIILSIGSACNSGSKKMSHVLESMNCPEEVSLGILRVSAHGNPEKDFRRLASLLVKVFREIESLCITKKNT